ncbi:MAG: putative lyase [Methanoregulaceae archaeon PtaB.Bin056]|nr:MAG: putative lyase [Methanoregulaceae archaeon PtaB.Bin056]
MGILEREARSSPDPHVRGYSLYLLGAEKDVSKKSLFVTALRDPDKGVRGQAASALAGLGKEAVSDLLDLLKDKEWRIRYRAAEALGMIGSASAAAALIQALADEKDHVRYMAAKSLGLMGERSAVTPLIARLSDENEYVRRMAAISLEKIGGEEAAAGIRRALAEAKAGPAGDALREALDKKRRE